MSLNTECLSCGADLYDFFNEKMTELGRYPVGGSFKKEAPCCEVELEFLRGAVFYQVRDPASGITKDIGSK